MQLCSGVVDITLVAVKWKKNPMEGTLELHN